MKILAEISVGELFDKITILNIKTKKISDNDKLQNIHTELKTLNDQSKKITVSDTQALNDLVLKLQQINEDLWDIENFKRECEAKKDFGESFIKLSRDVHFKNDKRAILKKEINLLSNSQIVEEKEYSKY
jgi:septation ring formation regulator EzrA